VRPIRPSGQLCATKAHRLHSKAALELEYGEDSLIAVGLRSYSASTSGDTISLLKLLDGHVNIIEMAREFMEKGKIRKEETVLGCTSRPTFAKVSYSQEKLYRRPMSVRMNQSILLHVHMN
jgi:hypothetical protein